MKRFSLFITALFCVGFAQVAFATPGSTEVADYKAYAALAAGIAIGAAAFGGALGQGKAAAAALEGIARNPSAADKIFTPMIIGLALIESLVIYGLLVGILLWTKV